MYIYCMKICLFKHFESVQVWVSECKSLYTRKKCVKHTHTSKEMYFIGLPARYLWSSVSHMLLHYPRQQGQVMCDKIIIQQRKGYQFKSLHPFFWIWYICSFDTIVWMWYKLHILQTLPQFIILLTSSNIFIIPSINSYSEFL